MAMRARLASLTGLWLVLCSLSAVAQQGAVDGEWRAYGADNGGTKYSPLDQINKRNVKDLEFKWSWTTVDVNIHEANPGNPRLADATDFECTPLMVGNVLYATTTLGQAAAIDATTGETLWAFNPSSYKDGRPPNQGWISRGAAYWKDGDDERIYYSTGNSWLYALDIKTGRPVPSFGQNGRVDLTKGVRGATHRVGYGHSSAPIICRGIVMVGSAISDGPAAKEGIPGRVKAFDARTGAEKWTFNTIPEEGEFGTETWRNGSRKYSGGANVWAPMAADDELGYVYLPTSTPTNDFYGGHRLGNNLFAESLICVNVETGARVWHFQFVHHGLWDYDTPCAPALLDVTVEGKAIKAVAQATKHGFVFVFDRVTGKPVWPIEERPVPQTDVPGEVTSPTQPFPTKPAPFTTQGASEDDLIDFTPELRAEAKEILGQFKIGPLFTPPGTGKPVIMKPSMGGGANWPGVGVDPETGILYVPSMNRPTALMLRKGDPARTNFRYTRGFALVEGPRGLPLFKPPYTQITAIDLTTGDHLWRVTNGGDGPINHEALKGLDLPPLGTNSRAGPLITKTLLFVADGSGRSGTATGGGNRLRAFDKLTGETLATFELPDEATGVPMTYMSGGKQFVVIAVGSQPAQLVALALP
jgi:quinoprotein glucose dehydrogenase